MFNCRDNHTMVSRQYSSIDIIHYILSFIDKGNKDASYCHLLTLKNLQMVHHARTIFYFVNCILDRFHISIFQISNSEELQDMYASRVLTVFVGSSELLDRELRGLLLDRGHLDRLLRACGRRLQGASLLDRELSP